MVRGRRAERERYWRGVVKKQQASGLSVAEFCRQNDVADALFYRWRRKLAELDERNEPPQEVGKSDREGRSEAAARFVPIELSPPPVSDRFEIIRPDGLRVLVPAQFEGEALREILRALQEVPGC